MSDDFDDEPEGLEQYAVVASRRQQWDVLLWQMPTMALTGEAFLLTIALAGSTSQAGRILASALAMIVALAALHSLSAHRLSELTDAAWLHEHEKTHGAAQIHGLTWRDRRVAIVRDQLHSKSFTDRLVARTYHFRSIVVWFWTMVIIALTAAAILVLAAVDPALFHA
ncbi:MAG: hypothetical protein WAN30_05330 [Acidimicrobiales bacterium]